MYLYSIIFHCSFGYTVEFIEHLELLLLLLSPLEFFTSALADGLLLEFEW